MGWAVPSVSKASLTLFGTRHRDVLPRCVSAEGPLASLGVTKREAFRVTKREGSGRQKKRGLGVTKREAFRVTKREAFWATKGGVLGDKRGSVRDDISSNVLPRCVSAEGPLALLGATKKKRGLGATKKEGSGR